jgi:hypothetical protein
VLSVTGATAAAAPPAALLAMMSLMLLLAFALPGAGLAYSFPSQLNFQPLVSLVHLPLFSLSNLGDGMYTTW